MRSFDVTNDLTPQRRKHTGTDSDGDGRRHDGTSRRALGGLVGQYSGAYQGSFNLNWQETGSSLGGTIQLSNPGGTHNITGNVQGSAITFGVVGGVTYSGSVSSNSMSGSYQVPGGGNGSWSATKAS